MLVSSAARWALMHEHRGAPEPSLEELLAKLTPVDLVLVEGFKRESLPKLEIWRRSVGKPLRAPEDPQVVAVASDGPVPETDRPVLPLDDVEAIADFIVEACGLSAKAAGARTQGVA